MSANTSDKSAQLRSIRDRAIASGSLVPKSMDEIVSESCDRCAELSAELASLRARLIDTERELSSYRDFCAADSQRLLYLSGTFDGMGDVDLHAKATEFCIAEGVGEEAQDQHYIAAIRFAIDTALTAERAKEGETQT